MAIFWKMYRKTIFIACAGVMILVGGVTFVRLVIVVKHVRENYRRFYTIGNDHTIRWTESGRQFLTGLSSANYLRISYLIGRPLPEWGYVVLVRWFQNASLSYSFDPQDGSSLALYRPDPKKPISLDVVVQQLRQHEKGDRMATFLHSWLGAPPAPWTQLKTISLKPVLMRGAVQSAFWVSLPDFVPPSKGIEAFVRVGAETWTVVAIGPTNLLPKRLQMFTNNLSGAPTTQKLIETYTLIGQYRPTGVNDTLVRAVLVLNLGQWGKSLYDYHQKRRERNQDFIFYKSFANDMRSKGLFPLAAAGFDQLAKSQTRDPFLRKNLGEMLMLSKNYALAIRAFRDLVALRPKSVDARLRLAKAYSMANFYPQALRTYKEVLKAKPPNPVALEGVARVCLSMQDNDVALRMASQALSINPSMPEAFEDLCTAQGRLKNFKDAVLACNRAVQLGPKRASAYSATAIVLFDNGQLDQALAYLKQADKLGPPDPVTLAYEGIIYSKMGKLKEAKAALELGVRLDPRATKLHELLSQVDLKMEDTDGFVQEKRIIATLSSSLSMPSSPNPSQGLRDSKIKADDSSKAKKIFF